MTVPRAPRITSPAKGAYTNTANGGDVFLQGTWSSAHRNDQLMSLEVQILGAGATDAAPGSVVKRAVPKRSNTEDKWSLGSVKWSGHIGGLAHHTTYKVRARAKGHDGWGPFSALSGQTFITNARSSVTALAWTTGTLVPTFSARIKSSDPGETISALQIQVMEDYASGLSVTRWDSGKVEVGGSGNTASLVYAGEALVWGSRLRTRALLWDASGQTSTWSSWLVMPLVQNVGPTVLPSDTVTRLSVTPTWSITRTSEQFDGYRLQAFQTDDLGGVPIYDSGLIGVTPATTANHTAATPLPLASSPLIRAAVRTTGAPDLGVWSAAVPNYISAAPAAPSSVTPGVAFDGSPTVVTPDPELTAVYEHPDRDTYGDVPSRREVEIWSQDLTQMLASSYLDSPAYTMPMVYTPPTLMPETTYAQRWRFKDALNNMGPWSAWTYFRASYPPTVTIVSPV